ncbi:hypothetical protein [Pseudalkalibacillus hwajinpoensis]|uniref:DUF3993 domain-containing protein n=1 Tax=Guptibacillus hwajinpoensis TaxID=208199 RepID=A0A4U1MFU9_9BACL|nr:hypothetical protein [Pseudalkalibacillus hwajinpoensis]TKD69156.1 hypothetical protein FBF83_14210 [Pseudalkalibacillus hwajinpoensis]
MKQYISFILIAGMLSITSGCGSDVTKLAENHSEMMLSSIENKAEAKTIAVAKPDVEMLSNELINRIMQDSDENFQVENFNTKEEINEHLQEVASEDLATNIADTYYEEREGSLYLIPTELFPWMDNEEPYELNQVNTFEYQLVQTNESDLYGTYTIEINFLYEENHWIIKNFTIK